MPPRLLPLVQAAADLRDRVDALSFAPPVSLVYNPLRYAWRPHAAYLSRYGAMRKRVVFLGMNPGPWGMAQTGVPFGEVAVARDWLGLAGPVDRPAAEHPKRRVEGFDCLKSEVSGRRLWGLFAERFGHADAFFAEHFVINYCPLVFMEDSCRNRTPDKLPAAESAPLFAACDAHLRACVEILEPEWVVGVGAFARAKAESALPGLRVKFAQILHPSPASPAANRGWSQAAARQLSEQGIWPAG